MILEEALVSKLKKLKASHSFAPGSPGYFGFVCTPLELLTDLLAKTFHLLHPVLKAFSIALWIIRLLSWSVGPFFVAVLLVWFDGAFSLWQ